MDRFEDNSPSITIRPEEFDRRRGGQRIIAWLSLLGALAFTIGTIVLLLLPMRNQTADPTGIAAAATATDVPPTPTLIIEPSATTAPVVTSEPSPIFVDDLAPIVDSNQLATLLQVPVMIGNDIRAEIQYDPFTVARGDRPRSEFLSYTVVQGDTIGEIASRYNLQQESLAWCNDRRIVLVLRPGDSLQIPPVDGACHRVLGTREETVASIAEQYNVDDAYAVIDSPYNPQLFGRTPSEILPGGTSVFIPGGEGPLIVWNPGLATTTDASGNISSVTFAPGQTGSCGNVTPAGGSYWGNPLPTGTWVRGFYAGHTGLDLSSPTGTPIYAANSGYVMFSGWSKWGYGYAVVIEHGSVLSTLYGHMSDINVGCGQFVNTGQIIGWVGSTGNSSGPHLHFEIRSGSTPQDPSQTPGIGW